MASDKGLGTRKDLLERIRDLQARLERVEAAHESRGRRELRL